MLTGTLKNQNASCMISSSLACSEFCRLLITFANSLDQNRQNVGSDLDPNRLTLSTVFLKDFFEKLILKKVSRRQLQA